MVKPKVVKTEQKGRGGVGTDEILRAAKADNIFTVKSFLGRHKNRIGKAPGKEAVYHRTVKKILEMAEKGDHKLDDLEFPAIAFEVLRHSK